MAGPASTIPALLSAAVAHDGARPLVTWYDDAIGGRAELSVASFANAVAKTANLLRDGLDLGPGARIGICLPPHWQYAVWLGACWSLGAVVVPVRDPASGPGPVDRPAPVERSASTDSLTAADLLTSTDALAADDVLAATDLFAATDLLAATDLAVVSGGLVDACAARAETVAVSLHPLGLPDRPAAPAPGALPAGVVDHAVEVRAHGDVFVPDRAPAPDDPAVAWPPGSVAESPAPDPATWSQAAVVAQAERVAARLGLGAGGRLLLAGDLAVPDRLVGSLAIPLVLGGSVVIVAHEDPARRVGRVAAERIAASLP